MENLLEYSIDLIIKEINALYNFKNSLENKLFCDTYNNGKYMELYLIPKDWLNYWKKNSEYNSIEKYLKDNNKKEINYEEYINYNDKPLFLPKINMDIYNKNKKNDYNQNIFNINKITLIDKASWNLLTFFNDTDAIKCHGL